MKTNDSGGSGAAVSDEGGEYATEVLEGDRNSTAVVETSSLPVPRPSAEKTQAVPLASFSSWYAPTTSVPPSSATLRPNSSLSPGGVSCDTISFVRSHVFMLISRKQHRIALVRRTRRVAGRRDHQYVVIDYDVRPEIPVGFCSSFINITINGYRRS
jgi:hypothetical protein